MKEIREAKTAGFCFGVRRSVEMAEKLLQEHGRVLSYGQLIHNDDVVRSLQAQGLEVIHGDEEVRPGDKVILRAHGVSEKTVRALEAAGAEVFDATCPKVKLIHKTVHEASEEGQFVLVIGMRNHPEVEAICGWCTECAVLENEDEARRWLEENPEFSAKPNFIAFLMTSTTSFTRRILSHVRSSCSLPDMLMVTKILASGPSTTVLSLTMLIFSSLILSRTSISRPFLSMATTTS